MRKDTGVRVSHCADGMGPHVLIVDGMAHGAFLIPLSELVMYTYQPSSTAKLCTEIDESTSHPSNLLNGSHSRIR
jgi:hypothetical protein